MSAASPSLGNGGGGGGGGAGSSSGSAFTSDIVPEGKDRLLNTREFGEDERGLTSAAAANRERYHMLYLRSALDAFLH